MSISLRDVAAHVGARFHTDRAARELGFPSYAPVNGALTWRCVNRLAIASSPRKVTYE
jgi:hypothetical protein